MNVSKSKNITVRERRLVSQTDVDSMYLFLGDRHLAKIAPASDINWLLGAYSQSETHGIEVFGSLWGKHSFADLHEYPVGSAFRESYLTWIYGYILDHFEKASLEQQEQKDAALFFLYFLYYSQPPPWIKIPLIPGINQYEVECTSDDIKTVLKKIRADKVFSLVPLSCNTKTSYVPSYRLDKKAHVKSTFDIADGIMRQQPLGVTFKEFEPLAGQYQNLKMELDVEKVRQWAMEDIQDEERQCALANHYTIGKEHLGGMCQRANDVNAYEIENNHIDEMAAGYSTEKEALDEMIHRAGEDKKILMENESVDGSIQNQLEIAVNQSSIEKEETSTSPGKGLHLSVDSLNALRDPSWALKFELEKRHEFDDLLASITSAKHDLMARYTSKNSKIQATISKKRNRGKEDVYQGVEEDEEWDLDNLASMPSLSGDFGGLGFPTSMNKTQSDPIETLNSHQEIDVSDIEDFEQYEDFGGFF